MRRIIQPWILAAAIVMGTPVAARAQYRAGGRAVPAADPTRANSTAARAPVVLDRVALLLDHGPDLSLSPDQATQLRAVEDSLQSLNLPLLGQLDTLRGPEGSLLPGDVAPANDSPQARRARQQAIAEVLASLHDNELAAHTRALGLLTPAQRTRAAGIEATAQKAFDKARSSRVRGGGWQAPRSTNNPDRPGSVVQPTTSWPPSV